MEWRYIAACFILIDGHTTENVELIFLEQM